jgi:1-acyl-sn-glycerol-3-phosphate acyltransferase
MARTSPSWWQVPYSLWAYAWFLGMVLPLGALGYALLSLSPARGRERRMLAVNNVLAGAWGLLCGIRYRVVDGDLQHRTRAFILVPTHTGTLDMMIASWAIRRGLRFLAKAELRRVPLLGFMFSRIAVFVRRDDADSRASARSALARLAERGVSLCIFPEGTRNRSAEPLGPFFDGAFATAIRSGLPLLPLVLYGGPRLMPPGQPWLRPGTLTARFLAPEPVEGLTEADTAALRDRVRARMLRAVLEGPGGGTPSPGRLAGHAGEGNLAP